MGQPLNGVGCRYISALQLGQDFRLSGDRVRLHQIKLGRDAVETDPMPAT